MNKKFDLVVGLEVHVTLNTKSKLLCSCKNNSKSNPNENVCEVCLGMPGALPVLNNDAVEKAIRVGKLLNCKINESSNFDRKHFNNIDLVKNFQITQFENPLLKNGYFEIFMGKEKEKKIIEIERIHIEEDAGKKIKKEDKILVDYNRSGVPLIEIVTKPCFYSIEEVRTFLEILRLTLKYNEISTCKMNEGEYRFDVNVSVKEKNRNSEDLGNRCEFKNLNSFTQCEKAIDKEYKRQIESKEIKENKKVKSKTLNWNEHSKKIEILRDKESIYEYRYLREYNLPQLNVRKENYNEPTYTLETRIEKLGEEFNLTRIECLNLLQNKNIEQYFIKSSSKLKNYKNLYNFLVGSILPDMKENEKEAGIFKVPSKSLSQLLGLLEDCIINKTLMKKIYNKMVEEKKTPKEIIDSENLKLLNEKDINKLIDKIIIENKKIVIDYKNGKVKALQTLIGKTIRESKDLADPIIIKSVIEDKLK